MLIVSYSSYSVWFSLFLFLHTLLFIVHTCKIWVQIIECWQKQEQKRSFVSSNIAFLVRDQIMNAPVYINHEGFRGFVVLSFHRFHSNDFWSVRWTETMYRFFVSRYRQGMNKIIPFTNSPGWFIFLSGPCSGSDLTKAQCYEYFKFINWIAISFSLRSSHKLQWQKNLNFDICFDHSLI